ncbi:PREDICTED: pancreatic trypsin inhibitor-like [Rhagoletis zephyria]|uniref:pancreatic trypsin inhibitor-like n=1 Tax=Rhagoletis zephyria TaxID=28612 RepID=UPI0008115547|nr:PREDICTED: pancreatic trypsin inhibitor-like [Rhagoletis zephyria]
MSSNNALNLKAITSRQLRSVSLLLLLILLIHLTREVDAGSFAVDRTVPACKIPRIPLLCESKILRYAYNATTGKCVSLYTSGCAPSAITKHFLTFEECRRDRMKILRY